MTRWGHYTETRKFAGKVFYLATYVRSRAEAKKSVARFKKKDPKGRYRIIRVWEPGMGWYYQIWIRKGK